MKTLEELHRISDFIKARQYKVKAKDQPFTTAERSRLSRLRACLHNIKEDGFVGGDSGVSPHHLEVELAWLQSSIVG